MIGVASYGYAEGSRMRVCVGCGVHFSAAPHAVRCQGCASRLMVQARVIVRADMVRSKLAAGATLKDIADEVGMSQPGLSAFCKREGIVLRRGRRSKSGLEIKITAKELEIARAEGVTLTALGAQYGCSAVHMSHLSRQLGVVFPRGRPKPLSPVERAAARRPEGYPPARGYKQGRSRRPDAAVNALPADAELERLYWSHSAKEIAVLYGVPVSTTMSAIRYALEGR